MTYRVPRARPLVMRVITRLAGGGPPVHATTLNRRLQEYGFDSVLVFGNCGAGEKNVEYLIGPGDVVERIPELGVAPSPWYDLCAAWKLWKLMRRYRPDIVHTHTAKAGFLGRVAAWLAGCPHVVHTFHGHVLEGYFSPLVNGMIRGVERTLGKLSDALLTVSQQQASELSERFGVAPAEKFRVVPLGIDVDPYLDLELPNFSAPELRLVWLGRFVPIKNVTLLLRVAELAQMRSLPVNFTLAGAGPEEGAIRQFVQERQLANVTLLPWQDDIRPVLQSSHALIMTSHREGTPLSLIQGMAAGRPFLSTAAGGTVDLAVGLPRLRRDSWWYENAVIVSPRPEAFVNVIEELARGRATLASMGRKSQEFATSRFTDTRLTADIASLYRGLLGDTARTPSVPERLAT